jgi:hypothetical protein
MATIEQKCNCKDTFQDKEYGVSTRLFNLTEKGTAKCTKCGAEVRHAPDKKK